MAIAFRWLAPRTPKSSHSPRYTTHPLSSFTLKTRSAASACICRQTSRRRRRVMRVVDVPVVRAVRSISAQLACGGLKRVCGRGRVRMCIAHVHASSHLPSHYLHNTIQSLPSHPIISLSTPPSPHSPLNTPPRLLQPPSQQAPLMRHLNIVMQFHQILCARKICIVFLVGGGRLRLRR